MTQETNAEFIARLVRETQGAIDLARENPLGEIRSLTLISLRSRLETLLEIQTNLREGGTGLYDWTERV